MQERLSSRSVSYRGGAESISVNPASDTAFELKADQWQKGMGGLFKARHFEREVIVLCVRWDLRFKLSLRDLVEMMVVRIVRRQAATAGILARCPTPLLRLGSVGACRAGRAGR